MRTLPGGLFLRSLLILGLCAPLSSFADSRKASPKGAEGARATKSSAGLECQSNNGHGLVLPRGKTFRVRRFVPETHVYEIYPPEHPAEKRAFVTLDAMIEHTKDVRVLRPDLLKKPDEIVDGDFVVETDLPTLFTDEVEARRACPGLRP